MSVPTVFVDDVGTDFIISIVDQDGDVINVSAATTKTIRLWKEGGTVVSFDASFVTDGSDGKIHYAAVADDINVPGDWKLQGFVVIGSNEWSTEIYEFTVLEKLE